MQVVTANRLADGVVVFLAADGAWSEWIEASRVAANAAEAAALLARGEEDERARRVVAPYLIEIERGADGRAIRAKRLRERIRAAGPTTRLDLGKQATGR